VRNKMAIEKQIVKSPKVIFSILSLLCNNGVFCYRLKRETG
jgi:hypothetical protein